MARRYQGVSRRAVWIGSSLALALLAGAWSATGHAWWGESQTSTPYPFESVEVRRVDLDTKVVAGGDLRAVKQATVSCQVEDLDDEDGTIVLSIVPNGKLVKKGDELCRLDSSAYEDLARQQEILVNQQRALANQARLILETTEISLREYQEGKVVEMTKEFQGRIAMGRSDVQRQKDRLTWTEGMEAKGYASRGQLLSERQALARAEYDLGMMEREFDVFRRYQMPKEIRAFQAEIETAQNNYRVEADRLKATEDRLAHLRKQIANCVIRAPQDGIVVHANNNRWWAPPLQAGSEVYQNEEMFMLPDLTRAEVEVSVHESVGPQIRVGMKAEVRIASQGTRMFPGRVVQMAYFPSINWKEWDEKLKHFIAIVRLDQTPSSALPYMSAMVEFDTGRVPDALVVPTGAITVVDGRKTCYVVGPHGLERRAIKTGHSTEDLVEVVSGLEEGERVALRAVDLEGIPAEDVPEDSPYGPMRALTASLGW
jgi:HlyD family secretion protein